MKLTMSYLVALYSTQKCTLYDDIDVDKLVADSYQSPNLAPSFSQVASIQKTLSLNGTIAIPRVIILVPDSWISVSQHILDHLVPTPLLPLAALSYAVETTFSTPETLLFNYQEETTTSKQTQLTVFACSAEWAEQICLPFKSRKMSCLLMSVTQWKNLRSRSWAYLAKNALSIYQPDYRKHQTRKRLWICLVLLSLLIHSLAYGYFSFLGQRLHQTILEKKNIVAIQSTWESSQESNRFATSVLTLIQGLPMSVRLTSFDAKDQSATFNLTLSKYEFERLLVNWQEAFPHWHWEVTEPPQVHSQSPSSALNGEVIDVFISIVES